ncbi:unnamed protein product [Phytophthora lilii]|uniref:Unnamed protein product n=1 Tax=Phytophthora lilii TaxID=2077276 RepID=A0A9W6TST7_9STRA|nr:unnamed protein product [Phytophthora lilii]
MLNEWKRLVQQRRTLQERQSLYKHQLNRELKGAYWRSREAARLHLKSWFRRWCTALNKDVNLARNHFRTRLLYNVVLSWWKTTIHSKQERVLVEAKQTIEKLSFYHPQQPAHAVHVDRGDNQKIESRQLNRKTNSKISNDTLIMRCEYMRSRRRMLDPTENPSYSKSYHNSEKTILHSKPSDRSILVQMAKIPIHRITDTRFRHQKSARRVERYPDCPRNNAYESEGERQGRTVVNETNTIAPVGDLVGHAMLQEMNFKNCDEPRANPILLEPSLSLESNVSRESRRRAAKSQSITRKKRVKVIGTSKKETKPLSDILALTSNDGADASFPNSSASKDNVSKDEPMWDSSVIHEIVGSYVDNTLHEYEKGKEKQSRIRTCFELVRDLMLFQNDFYIDELQNVYDDNFKDEFLELPPVVLDVDRREEQYRLELFLEQIVESHPMFRKYVARRSSQTAPLVSALNWLAQYHLRPQLMLQKRARARSKSLKEYWVWEPMPTEMKVSLEKLLPAITKYMRVLGQFFLRQAVQCSSTGDKPQDYRINSSAFINLMKQVCVFPQLFHRRELENAVRLSSCSSPEKEELNFPEFIEALLRCSCNLRWGELEVSKMANGSHNEETVVVIKFAMLIFAMEGQGTVLKKRNEDVNAILAFMGEQQKKKQAEKLFHFRKMLSDTKRRARAIKKPFSVWSQIRLQFPLHTSSAGSPTKSHDTFDELTESWDGGSPRRGSTEPFVFDAQTNQPFGIDMPGPPGEELIDELRNMRVHVRSSSTGSTEEEHGGSCVASGGNYLNKLRSDGATVAAKTVESSSFAGSYAGVEEELMPQQELINSTAGSTVTLAYQRQKGDTSSTDHLSNIRPALSVRDVHQEHQLPVPYQSAALEEPMHKDEFLREILDSIGDVKLMLNQPRFVGSNYLKQGR